MFALRPAFFTGGPQFVVRREAYPPATFGDCCRERCEDTHLLWPWFGRHCQRAATPPKIWSQKLSLPGFSPDEISIKTEENTVLVHATHQEGDEDNVERRECKRKITIPGNVNVENVKTSYSRDGMLTLYAPFDDEKDEDGPIEKQELVGHGTHFEDDGERKILKMDLSRFSPENVNIEVKNGVLHVHARQENERGFKETFRSFHLPAAIDEAQLSSTISEDGVLKITAPKVTPRSLPVTVDSENTPDEKITPEPQEKSGDMEE